MMNMIPSLAVIAVGVISGFLNACASGANTQSLLLLLTLGVDPLTANATNHLGGLTGLATASYRYIKNGIAKPQRSLYLAIPVIIGASGGSYYAASMLKGEQITGLAEIAVMIAIASLLISPDKWKQEGEVNPKSKISQSYRLIAALLGVGIWDGMVGAEAGMLILVILVWLGSYSLKQAVATKTILLSTAGVISTGIYASRGQVNLHIAYPLIAGNIAGAWIGSKVTVGRESEKIIYFLLLITMTGQSLLLFIRWVQH